MPYVRFSRLLAPLLALLVGAAAPVRAVASAGAAWVRVVGTNVVVYADSGPESATSIAERMELFHRLICSIYPLPVGVRVPPVTVIAFNDAREFAAYRPLYRGKPADFSGIFLPSREQSIVLLDASADAKSRRVVLHEYTHRMLSLQGRPVPIWLNEGIAELYSTAMVASGAGDVGAAPDVHVQHLREHGVMPLDRFFAVGHEDPEYNELRTQGDFYATAWLFVHYWTLEQRDAAGRERLNEFVRRITSGEPAATAFRPAFGTSMSDCEVDLQRTVERGEFRHETVALVDQQPAVLQPAAAAPQDELEFYLGLSLALLQRFADAEPHFGRAREINPQSPLPYEGLGLLALLQGNEAQARIQFGEAIKRGSTSHRANLAFANASFDDDGGLRDDAARAALERAIGIDPTDPEPYAKLSVLARRDRDFASALAWAERGVRAAPRDGEVRLALGLAQIGLRRYAAARDNLEVIATGEENAAIRASAENALRSLDVYTAAIAASEAVAKRQRPGGTPRPAERVDAPLAHFDELQRYFYRGAAGVRCRVRRIECNGKSVVVKVRVGEFELSFSNPSGDAVKFVTLNFNGVEIFDCDTNVDRDAIVQIDPSASDRFEGVVKSVVFLQPVAPSALTPSPGGAGTGRAP